MTDNQLRFAYESLKSYRDMGCDKDDYFTSRGTIENEKLVCEIRKTKTQISAVVYHG